MKNKGFTLIEILITVVVILIISGASYIAFIEFNNYQKLNTSYEDLRNTLGEARASALSQVINSCNTSETLVGHRVDITASEYILYEVCQSGEDSVVYEKKRKKIPSGVTLTAEPTSFLFLVISGEFSNLLYPGFVGTITLSSGSDTKTISVFPIGRIE